MSIKQYLEQEVNVQQDIALKDGVMIGQAYKKGCYTFLFQVEGFYVEFYSRAKNTPLRMMEVFDDTDKLSPYLDKIDIQEVLP